MVDREDLVELLPHYLVMLGLAIGTLMLLNAVARDLNFWIETGILVVVLVGYRPVVTKLGLAPSLWQRS